MLRIENSFLVQIKQPHHIVFFLSSFIFILRASAIQQIVPNPIKAMGANVA